MLEVKNIYFSYRKKPVLKNLSLSLSQGEIIGVLGVNGSGKSTLLKCLSNILVPQSGNIYIFGKDITKISRETLSKHIGYVAQNSLEEGITVFESILLGRTPHYKLWPKSNDLLMCERIMELLDLTHLGNRDITELSGGEHQKTIIARAFVQEPNLLLLDEPTNHLDIKNQLEVMNIISHLAKMHNVTVMVSIHDLNLCLQFVDKIILLKDHRIIFFDRKENLNQEILKEIYGVNFHKNELDQRTFFFPEITQKE